MTEPQAVLDSCRRTFDVEATASAQFAGKAHIETPFEPAGAQHFTKPKFGGKMGLRILEPIEIIGDREMLGDIALPGRHGAAIGLHPIRHRFRSLTSP